MSVSSRGLFVAAFAAVAAAASAQINVDLVSVGTYNNSFGPFYTTSETVIYSDLASIPVGSNLAFFDNYSPNFGTATYTGGGNTLVLDVTVTNFVLDPGNPSLTSSMDGYWTLDSALSSGIYAGLRGSGTISAGYNQAANAFSSTTVVGNLEPVPEPATFAVIGMGVLGLMRRRRRA